MNLTRRSFLRAGLVVAAAPMIVRAASIMPVQAITTEEMWVVADGRSLNRAFYAELFSAIGTTYGVGNGVSTFNLPDLRGHFPNAIETRILAHPVAGVSAVDISLSPGTLLHFTRGGPP